MVYEYWYLANAGLSGVLLAYFVREAFQGFRTQKWNILFLAINSMVLLILINQYKKVVVYGIGQWGVNPAVSRKRINWLEMVPSLSTFLFLSIIVAGITFLIASYRTIKLLRA